MEDLAVNACPNRSHAVFGRQLDARSPKDNGPSAAMPRKLYLLCEQSGSDFRLVVCKFGFEVRSQKPELSSAKDASWPRASTQQR